MISFIKNNILLLAVGLVTFGITTLFIVLLVGTQTKLDNLRDEINTVKNKKENIRDFKYSLKRETMEQTGRNRDIAREKYVSLINEIHTIYPSPISIMSQKLGITEEEVKTMKNVNLVRRLNSQIAALNQRYEAAGISLVDKGLTFNDYVNGDILPKEEEIPQIVQQLAIVDELSDVLITSRLKEVKQFERNDGIALKEYKSHKYQYSQYELEIVGDYVTIQNFLNNINKARFLFITRNLVIFTEDLAEKLTSDKITDNKAIDVKDLSELNYEERKSIMNLLPKGDRVVFPQLSQVTLKVTLDYVFFDKPKE
ncbi:MAG: Amuc_1100 family pilus-like protein [Lentisphaeria bacterium]|nr:Amuc_1100 family pilus-like protein [Lentisphaeria bacterium]